MIHRGIYGCYLISGERGVGKSSFIRTFFEGLGRNFNINNNIYITLTTFDYECEIGIIDAIITRLYNESLENGSILFEYNDALKKLYEQTKWSYNEEITLDDGNSVKQTVSDYNINKQDLNINIHLKNVLLGGFIKEKNSEITKENSKYKNENIEKTKTRKKVPLDEQLSKLLSKIVRNTNIFVVFDELDKQDDCFLETLFNKYKSLLLENGLISFFITDEKTYRKYGEDIDNYLGTYFIDTFYLPRMTYNETLRYCYIMFGEEHLWRAQMMFYGTLGNRRLINIFYAREMYITRCDFNTMYEYCKFELLSFLGDMYYNTSRIRRNSRFEQDEFIYNMKKIVELIFFKGKTSCNELFNIYNTETAKTFVSRKELIDGIKKFCESNNWIEVSENEFIEVDFEQIRYCNIKEEAILPNEFMYYDKSIHEIQQKIHCKSLIKLGDNDSYAYKNALEKIIIGNLNRIKKVVIIERKLNSKWPYEGASDYSAAAAIGNNFGGIDAFYNDRGSYSYEGRGYIEEFIEIMGEYGITIYYKFFQNETDLEECVRIAFDSDNLEIIKSI